jgi:hypothetical protein
MEAEATRPHDHTPQHHSRLRRAVAFVATTVVVSSTLSPVSRMTTVTTATARTTLRPMLRRWLRGAHSGATMNAIAEQAAERVVHRVLSDHRETSPSAHSNSSAPRSEGAATATAREMHSLRDQDISAAAAVSSPSASHVSGRQGAARWPRLLVHHMHRDCCP